MLSDLIQWKSEIDLKILNRLPWNKNENTFSIKAYKHRLGRERKVNPPQETPKKSSEKQKILEKGIVLRFFVFVFFLVASDFFFSSLIFVSFFRYHFVHIWYESHTLRAGYQLLPSTDPFQTFFFLMWVNTISVCFHKWHVYNSWTWLQPTDDSKM